MVTKLKSLIDFEGMTEKKRSAFLALLILQESLLLSFVMIFSRYTDYYSGRLEGSYEYLARTSMIKAMALAGAAAVLGLLLVRCLLVFRKRNLSGWLKQPVRADRIRTEILTLVLFLSALFWSASVLGASPMDFRTHFAGSGGVWQGCVFSVQLLFFMILFYGSLLILLRQWKRGILAETSVIRTVLQRYRDRTSLERRLQNRRRGSLLLAVLFLFVGLIGALFSMDYSGEPGAVAGFALIVLFILFLRAGFFGRLTRETGCLAQQIQCMTDGKELPKQFELGEKALLHDTSVQLKNIESAMRRSVEKQVQAERLKIDLITNVSHDLKTPLTSMVGYTDLLKKEDLSAEARDYVEIISAKQEQLKNMIQDLFDLSKSTSGEDQMTIETLDMRRLLEQTLADMEDVIRASGREIRTNFMEEPLLFFGDNNKMYRVVQNLLGNALKYSLESTRIYLDASRREGQVEMQIKNIASYEMDFSPDEITERFVRGDKARTTEGHGLGLAIASSFIHNMGGTLSVSIDGDLFKVTVRVPAAA